MTSRGKITPVGGHLYKEGAPTSLRAQIFNKELDKIWLRSARISFSSSFWLHGFSPLPLRPRVCRRGFPRVSPIYFLILRFSFVVGLFIVCAFVADAQPLGEWRTPTFLPSSSTLHVCCYQCRLSIAGKCYSCCHRPFDCRNHCRRCYVWYTNDICNVGLFNLALSFWTIIEIIFELLKRRTIELLKWLMIGL